MFALLAAVAPARTQALYLQNGMSEAAIRDHEIQKNSDMIDFCTTTYSSVRNREYCIDVSSAWPRACVRGGAQTGAQLCSCKHVVGVPRGAVLAECGLPSLRRSCACVRRRRCILGGMTVRVGMAEICQAELQLPQHEEFASKTLKAYPQRRVALQRLPTSWSAVTLGVTSQTCVGECSEERRADALV